MNQSQPSTAGRLASMPLSSSSPTIAVAFFGHARDTQPSQKAMAWGKFAGLVRGYATDDPVQVVTRPTDPKAARVALDELKKSTGRFSPVRYREGATRGNDGVGDVHAFVADLDGSTREDTDAMLDNLRARGLRFVGWTTWSHGVAKPNAWRVVVPLTAPVPAALWSRVWAAMNDELFKGKCDESTSDPARMHTLPARPEATLDASGAWVPTVPVEVVESDGGAPFDAGQLTVQAQLDEDRDRMEDEARMARARDARANESGTDRERRARYAQTVLDGVVQDVASTPTGQGKRRNALMGAAYRVGAFVQSGDLDADTAERELYAAAERNSYVADHSQHDARDLILSGFRKAKPWDGLLAEREPPPRARPSRAKLALATAPVLDDRAPAASPSQLTLDGGEEPVQPEIFALTDTGNAERFARYCRRDARYSYALERWFVWDGTRWAEDSSGAVERMGKDVVRSIPAEAKGLPGDKWTAAMKWAAHSERANSRANMLRLAQSEDGLQVKPEDMNRAKWLLNVENGTIDLRTGQLRPHDRADMLTNLAPVRYDPNAKAPVWEAFLARVLPDADVRGYMQRLFGYCLTGEVSEQIFPVLYGNGGNGKSTLIEAFQYVMGHDYAGTINPQALTPGNGREDDDERNALALFGKRLCVASETKDQRRLNEAFVKKITGGDTLRARWLYAEAFDFEPTHKILMLTNHKPQLVDTSEGLRRRLVLIPWTVKIEADERDPMLGAKLRAEAPGILAWMVRGCLEWQRVGGLRAPASIQAATEGYFHEEDPLAEFLQTRCVIGERELAGAKDVFEAYQDWAHDEDIPDADWLPQKAFGKALTGRGFERVRTTVDGKPGRKAYRGIGIRNGHGQASRGAGDAK